MTGKPTDDLRTRIAAAVWMRHRAEAFAQCGLDALAVPEHPIPNWAYGMADAVIRELGRYEYAVATRDMEFICMYVDERSELNGVTLHPDEQIVRRHVTEWENDD